MLSITSAQFNALFPELASTNPATIDALNAPARVYVSESQFGGSGQYGLGLVIAHMITLGSWMGGGAVTNDKIGDLSTSQAALPTDQAMKMTSYGLRFLELGRILCPPIVVGNGMGTDGEIQPFSGFQPTFPSRGPGNGYTWGN